MVHSKQTDGELSERAQQLLKTLVERYIRDGQPVGSRTLSRDSRLAVSPATIRNTMADLEELGLVRAPHTSAGRVPTVLGYRFFIDSLLTVKPLGTKATEQIRQELGGPGITSSKRLVASASNMLSGLTRLAGIVTVPRQAHTAVRQIEFLQLSEQRVLAILVLNNGEVQNFIVHPKRDFTESELRHAANFLSAEFAGLCLGDARAEMLRKLRATRESLNESMLAAIQMAEQVFDVSGQSEERYVLAGQTNLMDFDELSDIAKLRGLFNAFNEQRDILHLLDQCLCGDGVQIFIGEESGYDLLDEMSLVTAPYSIDDQMVGVLGVIGPTRMAYERVIPVVDLTARMLGAALKSQQ